MASSTVVNICFQDKIPVILTTCLELETYIKSHHVYKEIRILEFGEQLHVLIETDNCVDKFTVCAEKKQAVVGHLKKGDSGKFAKRILYFLRSDIYFSCYANVSAKRCNLKDGEGLQVPCKMILRGQKNM